MRETLKKMKRALKKMKREIRELRKVVVEMRRAMQQQSLERSLLAGLTPPPRHKKSLGRGEGLRILILDGFERNRAKPIWSRNRSRSELRTRNPTNVHGRASPTHLEGYRGPGAKPQNSDVQCPAEGLISY
jgi:hypothetical protein